MRRLLVDAARRRRAGKRSGGTRTVALDPDRIVANQPPNLAALDLALDALAREDPRKARVVELRFFGGLSVDETAAVLGVSADTVGRDWKFARAWLRRAMQATPPAHV
jgi:RNA polymerase sigma factor (TIGR02999 family)